MGLTLFQKVSAFFCMTGCFLRNFYISQGDMVNLRLLMVWLQKLKSRSLSFFLSNDMDELHCDIYPYALYLQQLYQNIPQNQTTANQIPAKQPIQLPNYVFPPIPLHLQYMPYNLAYLNQLYTANPLHYSPNTQKVINKNGLQSGRVPQQKVVKNKKAQVEAIGIASQQQSQVSQVIGPDDQQLFDYEQDIHSSQEEEMNSNYSLRQNMNKDQIGLLSKSNTNQSLHKNNKNQDIQVNNLPFPALELINPVTGNEQDQEFYLSHDFESLDRFNKQKRLFKMRQFIVESFIEKGEGKKIFQQYLRKKCPKMDNNNIQRQCKLYLGKMQFLLRRVIQKLVDLLELTFHIQVVAFTHHQKLRLIRYLRVYKLHFSLQEQKTIIQFLKYFINLQKIPMNKQKVYNLYRTFRLLLSETPKIENSEMSLLKFSNCGKIDDFLKQKEKLIKTTILSKQSQNHQNNAKVKLKQKMIGCFRQFQDKQEWKKLYRLLNPQGHFFAVQNEVQHVLKVVFLQAFYKLQQAIMNSKIGYMNKYLQYIKGCIIAERILTLPYRNLAIVMLDIYEDKGEFNQERTKLYIKKLKESIKRTRDQDINSKSPFLRQEYEKRNFQDLKQVIKHIDKCVD